MTENTEPDLYHKYLDAKMRRDAAAFGIAHSWSQMVKHRDDVNWESPDSYLTWMIEETAKYDAIDDACSDAYKAWIDAREDERRGNDA